MASTERRPPARSVSRLLWQTSWSAEPATTTTAMGGPRTSTSSAAPARAPPAPAYADPDTPRGGEERQRRSSTTSNGGGGFGGAPPLSRSSSQRRLSVPNLSSADARTDAWVGAAVATAGGTEVDLTARASQLRAEAALLEAAAVVVAGPTGAGRGHVTDGESVAKAASKPPRRSSTSKPREPPPRQAACLPAGATPPWECLAQVRVPRSPEPGRAGPVARRRGPRAGWLGCGSGGSSGATAATRGDK